MTATRFFLFLTIASLCFDQVGIQIAGRLLIPSDLFGILLIACSLGSLFSKRLICRANLALLSYPASVLLSGFFSSQPRSALGPVLTACYLVALCWAFKESCPGPEARDTFFLAWRILAALVAVGIALGLILFLFGRTSPTENYWLHFQGTLPDWLRPRLDGWLQSPNRMCDLIILIFGVSFCDPKKKKYPFLYWALAILSIFSFSSGLGALFLLWAWHLGGKWSRSVAVIVAALLLLINSFSFPHFREGEFYPSHRARAWIQAGQHFAENPLLGTGPGQADIRVDFYYPNGRPTYIAEAHSLPLSLLSQVGLIGAAAFVWPLMMGIMGAPRRDFPLVQAVALSVAYHGLTGSFEDSRHLWIVLGYLLCQKAASEEVDRGKSSSANPSVPRND